MPMIPHNTWVAGFAWEYVNMAAKSGEDEHVAFLVENEVDIERALGG